MTDVGLLEPMQDQLHEHFGRRSHEHLADGGFSLNADIEAVESHTAKVYSPVKAAKNKAKNGSVP